MTFKSHILSIFFMLLAVSLSAQVKFEAKVSKSRLGLNERLRVDFNMNEDGDNFNPPNFENFIVLGGPNQSVSYSYANGKKSFNKTYTFFLAPKNKGSYRIDQASIEIGGQVYKTSPITITVTNAIAKPKDPNNVDYIASEKVHLVASISNTEPYLNEAISVEYRLYVSLDTGVENWRELDNPRFNDFWSQNLKMSGLKKEKGKFKGEDYRYVVLRRVVLYPQKTGKLELEPLILDVTVTVPSNKRDFFGRQLMSKVNRTISAGTRTIDVKPLPTEGKPADFTGAVGNFTFDVKTTKTELNATESLQASVEVKGTGNLKLFTLPKLSVPSSLEVYEPEHSENVTTTISGMRGGISDNYTIVPQYKGKYPIPKISFSYFDLNTESYKRISSDEIIVDVIEGPANSSNNDSNLAATDGTQPLSVGDNQFAFIKTSTNLKSMDRPQFFNSTLFWSSLLLPLLAIPLALVYKRKREEWDADIVGSKVRTADKLAKRYLGEARKNLGQKEDFYIALQKALHNYLKAKLRIETSEFSKEHIRELLAERGVNGDTVSEFNQLLKNCELARYTPITIVEMQKDYDNAAKTISIIDKELK